MKRIDLIHGKAAQIRLMIADLENNQKVLVAFGHAEDASDLDFQRKRLAVLEWAETHTEKEIEARIDGVSVSLGIAVFSKYGSVKGLPAIVAEKICEVELLELALGTHPAVGGVQ